MSAWYLFSALGFYPLQVGSPTTRSARRCSRKATVHLRERQDARGQRPEQQPAERLRAGPEVNGRRYDKTYLPHAVLAKGGPLDFDMGPKPSAWATRRNRSRRRSPTATRCRGRCATSPARTRASPSRAAGPTPRRCSTTRRHAGDARRAPTIGRVRLRRAAPGRLLHADLRGTTERRPARMGGAGLRRRRQVGGPRPARGETFPWRKQTRPFELRRPGTYAHYRVRFTKGGDASTSLSEIELLLEPADPGQPAVGDGVAGLGAGGLDRARRR